MPRYMTLAALLIAFHASADAQPRDGDRIYAQEELAALLDDHALEFFSGGVSRYRADGAYSYKYTDNDRPNLGTYQVLEGGEVCVLFQSGSRRCDTYVDDGERMVMIIADGTRFPIRDHRPLVDGY